MITETLVDNIRPLVLKKVRELQPTLVRKYEAAVTPWMIRTILECAQQIEPDWAANQIRVLYAAVCPHCKSKDIMTKCLACGSYLKDPEVQTTQEESVDVLRRSE